METAALLCLIDAINHFKKYHCIPDMWNIEMQILVDSW